MGNLDWGSWDCLVAAGQLSGKGAGSELWEWLGVGADQDLGAEGAGAAALSREVAAVWHKGQWSWLSSQRPSWVWRVITKTASHFK